MTYQALNYEEFRLSTFKNWPFNFPIKPNDLAKNGFYYSGKDLKVVCYSCQKTITDWTPNDIVELKHWLESPDCDFLKSRLNNVPIPVVINEDCDTPYRLNHFGVLINVIPGNDVCGSSHIIGNQISFSKSQPERPQSVRNYPPRPQHLNQISLENRLQTFFLWSDDFPVRAYSLAEAGFFYTGIQDKVICFNCGIQLHNWEENDDAWIEHSRFSPFCELVEERIRSHGEISSIRTTTVQNKEPTTILKTLNLKEDDEEEEETVKNKAIKKEEEEADENELICKICMIEKLCIVFLPCGHLISCKKCSVSLTHCAICRVYITQKIKVYMS